MNQTCARLIFDRFTKAERINKKKSRKIHTQTNNEFKLLFDALEKQQQMKNRSIQEDRKKKLVQKTKSVDKDDERQQNASKEA